MKKYKSLTNSETASFCGQLALLLPAGISILEGIQLMMEDSADNESKELLLQIEAALLEEKGFSEALAATGVFPEYVTSMVLLGEEAGKLDIVMARLADYYAQQDAITTALKNAVRYPLIMLGLMIIILFVLITKVLPIFNQVFLQLGSGLTGASLSLMKLGGIFQAASGALVLILTVLAAVLFILSKSAHLMKRLKHILHTCRLTKNFFMNTAYSRFACAMSMLISSGIDIFKELDIINGIVENELFSQKLAVFQNSLRSGDYINDAIKKAGIFKAQHQKILQISYKTGDSDRVFTKLSEYYEDAALNQLHRLLDIIEPALVIIFSFVTGIILISVIMPLIGIMSGI